MRASEWAYIWDKAVPQIRIGICLFLLPFYLFSSIFMFYGQKKNSYLANKHIYILYMYIYAALEWLCLPTNSTFIIPSLDYISYFYKLHII